MPNQRRDIPRANTRQDGLGNRPYASLSPEERNLRDQERQRRINRQQAMREYNAHLQGGESNPESEQVQNNHDSGALSDSETLVDEPLGITHDSGINAALNDPEINAALQMVNAERRNGQNNPPWSRPSG